METMRPCDSPSAQQRRKARRQARKEAAFFAANSRPCRRCKKIIAVPSDAADNVRCDLCQETAHFCQVSMFWDSPKGRKIAKILAEKGISLFEYWCDDMEGKNETQT